MEETILVVNNDDSKQVWIGTKDYWSKLDAASDDCDQDALPDLSKCSTSRTDSVEGVDRNVHEASQPESYDSHDEVNNNIVDSADEEWHPESEGYSSTTIDTSSPNSENGAKIEAKAKKRSKDPERQKWRQRLACKICDKKVTRGCMAGHLRVHTGEKPYLCETCGSTCSSKVGLRRHIAARHTDEKPFICDKCGLRFRTNQTLTSHITNMHMERRYECGRCHKFLASTVQLKGHERRCSGEKNFACPYNPCEKRFFNRTGLRVHMKIHTGDKPYQCEYCEKTFSQKSNMRSHVRIHTGEKPYRCDVCGEGFSHNVCRKAHMKKHHQ